MQKLLSEMSLTELWQLFPIILVKHNPIWSEWYDLERERLRSLLPDHCHINHIGSTAVSGIWAKPIIDILVECPTNVSMLETKALLETNGYTCMSISENRMSFNLGYGENGFKEKVFHLHLRYFGDNDELYCRDYLNDNQAVAKEYEHLKLSLWHKFEHDRDGYTNAKTEFVKKYTNIAIKNYKYKFCS